MGNFYPIDIKGLTNHKLIYEKEFKIKCDEEIGLDGMYLLLDDLKLSEHEVIDGIDFLFCFNECDNISCDKQRIKIEDDILKIHIIGFAYWGGVVEFLKIIYDDFTEEDVEVPFLDWSKNISNTWTIILNKRNISTCKTTKTYGVEEHVVNLHHITCELSSGKKVKEIVLPNNMLTHVFAITIEKN